MPAVQDLTEDDYDLIEEGPASTVSRTWTAFQGREPQWIVAKSATIRKKFSKEPHDIVKELRILSKLSHVNIISVLSHFRDPDTPMLTIYLPYLPFSLAQLLSVPFFLASIAFQILRATSYLHDPARRIAHRDIKPCQHPALPAGLRHAHRLWNRMGGHRWTRRTAICGPRTLHGCTLRSRPGHTVRLSSCSGTRAYDAPAIDMWSFGTVLAEMFSTLRLSADDDENEPVPSAQAGDPPFVVPPQLQAGQPDTQWSRDTLFNGRRGEIGLAWSIFKIRGTPTDETWPGFRTLPGASNVDFMVVPRVPLASFLPNVPQKCAASVLNLIERFLAYPPPDRLPACDALAHAWFNEGAVLLPRERADDLSDDPRTVFQVDDRALGDFLSGLLA
ncbi:CMGC/CDK protein kinase [Mycena rebaudengoi]|nr:CMGC/CDK protein kinase [Mycena rebaudengoi]